jgi:phosphoribosylglycinamide formyltransferase-1
VVVSKKNLAVFISGQGTNLEVILKNKVRFNKVFVVSSKPDAFGLTRAAHHEVPSKTLDTKIDWQDLQYQLEAESTDLIFMAGFMKILPESFIKNWEGRLFNLHPSLLPKYRGLNAIERAYKAQDDIGVSIHHVVAEVDAGQVVLQKVAVAKDQLPGMSLEQVTEAVHKLEHQLVYRWLVDFT